VRTVTVAEGARLLRSGAVGLVPTETVVGLVAGDAGLSRLAGIKGRDPNKPIALLCASPEHAFALVGSDPVPPPARRLADRFWPGSLTLVLDAKAGGTVGVRVPDHPTVQALLAAYGGPLHATSANPAGGPAPRSLGDVNPKIADAVDFAVEGESGSGEASAVVDLSSGRVRLLRGTRELDEAELTRLTGAVPPGARNAPPP
jgi:L-threonylcarbamoyladenylate synthase